MIGWVRSLYRLTMLVLCLLMMHHTGLSQGKRLKGFLKDSHSDEPIPFASVQFRNTSIGKLSDSSGRFAFLLNQWPSDTLQVTFVGYQDMLVPIDTSQQEINLNLALERGKVTSEVVVRGKINRGLLLWRRIVKNKPINDRRNFENFGYELYNKLQLDLNRVDREKLSKVGLLKPFQFILDNIDTVTEKDPILPIYLTEALSDYYYQASPKKTLEQIKANKTAGFKNESVAKLTGGMEQNINVYDNFIPVFDLNFVSPISKNGDAFYNYKVPDTQYIAGKRVFHFVFSPKHKGENTFVGDAWIEDSSYAVMKMNMQISETANINFVNRLSIVQEFQRVSDSVWFLAKDKFIADFSLLGRKKGMNVIGRKTTTYRDVRLNDPAVQALLDTRKLKEEVVLLPGSYDVSDSVWISRRHEELNTNEKAIYKMVDTMMSMPVFKRYARNINFLATGYKNVGNYQIGPWFNWITANVYEGLRLRFDLGTNRHFSKRVYFAGYLAYGFLDQRFKGKFEALYMLNKKPRTTLYAKVFKDIDNGQQYYDEVGADNIFALAVRKPNAIFRFMKQEQQQLRFYHERPIGLSFSLTLNHVRYIPLQGIPGIENFSKPKSGDPLNTFEVSTALRFSYLEQFLENTFFRSSLGSDYPTIEFRYTRGVAGVLNSGYTYNKYSMSISDEFVIPKLGRSFYFNVFAGKTDGTLPYPMLDIAPGNNIYYLNKYAFNLMTRFEYIGDEYAGFNIEHNIGNGLFRLIPPTRRLKFRQFWNAKLLVADLSEANRNLNFVNGHPFRSLDGKPYLELGTGVDNIFKFLRFDFIWRVLPDPSQVKSYERFGVFGSFRVSF